MDPLRVTMKHNQEVARKELARKKALFDDYLKDKPLFPSYQWAFNEVINILENELEAKVALKPAVSITLSFYNTRGPSLAWNQFVEQVRQWQRSMNDQEWFTEIREHTMLRISQTQRYLEEEWRLRHPAIGCKWDEKTFIVGDL